MPQTPPVVLTIAGFDPSSGAGITADIKTIAAHGCYGVAAITALTVQSTAGVRRWSPVNPRLLQDSLEELIADVKVSAVHIGMLGSGAVTTRVARFLEIATGSVFEVVSQSFIARRQGYLPEEVRQRLYGAAEEQSAWLEAHRPPPPRGLDGQGPGGRGGPPRR